MTYAHISRPTCEIFRTAAPAWSPCLKPRPEIDVCLSTSSRPASARYVIEMSPFPVELHIHILRQLPGRDPASTRAVASYLAACSVTRAAALDNAVWAHLYRDRYASRGVSEKLKESERHVRLQGDWHLMYIERYTIDRTALRLLDHIRAHPEDLQESAKRFALECSFDAWGALEIEAEVPIPRAFRDPELDDTDQEAAQEALPRRFWANAALGALYRLQAIQTWCRVIWETDRCTFEEVLIVLSAFCDVPSYKVGSVLSNLESYARLMIMFKYSIDCR